ncbi:ROK family protein [Parabacteroides sp.]
MNTYLALDLGGTKLLIGEIDDQGNVLRHKKYESGYFNQPAALEFIKQSLDDYIATVGWKKKPIAMGLGVIGRINPEQGEWLQIDPKRTTPIPLAKELSKRYDMPCFIDNDVKSATRAVQLFGLGKTSKNFIYINVGTGIAAGAVVNGQIIRGGHFNAGEVGHTHSGLCLGIPCGCGRNDCVEQIASGIGFNTCARILREKYPTRLQIPEDQSRRVDATEIFSLSKQGDPLCVQLVENASMALANLIMNLTRMSDPEMIVLGGGIVSDGYLHTKILEKLNPTTMRFVTHGVVLTKLNPNFIGLIGAGAVAMNEAY